MEESIIETGGQVFQYLAGACSSEGLEKAGEAFSLSVQETKELFRDFSIPALTSDKDVKEVVKKFNLQNPEQMVRFFVEGYIATIEGIYEDVNDLKVQNLQGILGEISGAINMVKMGIDNPESEREKLGSAQNQLLTASGKLEKLIEGYINKIKEIDQRSGWRFFLRARTSVKDIDINVMCAKQAADALETTIRTQMLIAVKLNMKIDNAVIAPYLSFAKNTFSDSVCDLMHAYDVNKQEGYWKKMSLKIMDTESAIVSLKEYMQKSQKSINQKGGLFKWLITAGKMRRSREMQQ